MKKQISHKLVALTFGVLVACFAIVFYAVGFTEPTLAPPGGNVDLPLNTGNIGQSKEGGLVLNTGGAENGLIVQDGKVGIGTVSPSAKLEVVGDILSKEADSYNQGISLRNGAGQDFNFGFMSAASDADAVITREGTGGIDINIKSNGNLIIGQQGDVGVGTASPTEKLEVGGNIKASGTVCDSNGCIGGGVLSCSFGDWQLLGWLLANTEYGPVLTDGFLLISTTKDGAGGADYWIYSGVNADILVASDHVQNAYATRAVTTIPIKAGHKYKIIPDDEIFIKATWIPFECN